MRFLLILIIFFLGCTTTPKKEVVVEDVAVTLTAEEESLFKALRFKETALALSLIPKVRINLKTNFKETFTHVAVHSGLDMLKTVVEKGAPLDESSRFSITPLMATIEMGLLKEAEFLLEKGANINHKDMLGSPLFFIALKKKNLAMLKLLMKYRFNPNEKGFMDETWETIDFAKELMSDYVKGYKKTGSYSQSSFS